MDGDIPRSQMVPMTSLEGGRRFFGSCYKLFEHKELPKTSQNSKNWFPCPPLVWEAWEPFAPRNESPSHSDATRLQTACPTRRAASRLPCWGRGQRSQHGVVYLQPRAGLEVVQRIVWVSCCATVAD